MLEKIKEYWVLIVFFVGILTAVFLVHNQRRRTDKIRDAYTELGKSLERRDTAERTTDDAQHGLESEIVESMERIEEIERIHIERTGSLERARDEVREALDIINTIRNR